MRAARTIEGETADLRYPRPVPDHLPPIAPMHPGRGRTLDGRLVARLVLGVAFSLPILGPPTAFAQERKIAPGTWVGCINRGALEQIAAYRAKQDVDAATKEQNAAIRTGRCTTFKTGESVIVTETTMIAGVTKIRRAGETAEYWVFREAVPR